MNEVSVTRAGTVNRALCTKMIAVVALAASAWQQPAPSSVPKLPQSPHSPCSRITAGAEVAHAAARIHQQALQTSQAARAKSRLPARTGAKRVVNLPESIAGFSDMLCENGVCLLPSTGRKTPPAPSEWREEAGKDLWTGVCKRWEAERGFGFITMQQRGASCSIHEQRDIFVHQSDLDKHGFRSLAVGEMVSFRIMRDDARGRIKATSVKSSYDDYDDIFDELFGI